MLIHLDHSHNIPFLIILKNLIIFKKKNKRKMTYNPDHPYDMEEKAIKKRIDAWLKGIKVNGDLLETIEKNGESFFTNEKAYKKWKSTTPDIKGINRAREKMINGLTQFMDGLGDLKEISGTWIVDPDYINLIFMTAFSKSVFYEKTMHWAKAEETFQKERATDLPGGFSGNGKEIIVRDHATQWFSLQFLYRQFEFTRFVPNYNIVSGIWDLEQIGMGCSQLLDQWFYIHSENIKAKTDLTDFTKGYFFKYNANMTSQVQTQTLDIIAHLFSYSMSKSLGTFEQSPWFRDSTITGNSDGDLPNSKNIIPHKVNLDDVQRLATAPIVQREEGGMMTIPTGEDGILKFDEGWVWVENGEVVKIKTSEGRVEKLRLADGTRYKVGQKI